MKRRIFSTSGVAVVVALCFLPAGAQPTRPEKLTVAYVASNVYLGQFAGAQEKGWFNELGVKQIDFQKFTSGIPMMQAIAAGQIDVAYIGAGPVLIAGHQNVPVKSVAATSKDTLAFVTLETFATIYAAHQPPAAAFAAFAKQTGRKLRIGTLPRGATPDVFLRMWLARIGVDPEKDVTIIPMGVDQLVAAMATGQVDGIVSGEPWITLLKRADPKFKVLLYAKDLVAGLPGGVVMVQQRLIDQYPATVEKLVEIHLRVNKLFNTDKDFFARTATKYLGLSSEVSQEAVRSPTLHLVGNHRALANSMAVYDAFEVKMGVWPKPLRIEDVFEYRFYDAVVKRLPELAD